MAQYKYREALHQSSSSAFDTRHAPGTKTENSGIYRCSGCGDEIAITKGSTLPTADHHHHEPGMRKIEWQMIVFAEQFR